jgi:CheY-like chemotaxis protein
VMPELRCSDIGSTILVAEDRQADIQLLQRAFVRAGLKNPVRFVRDGGEVLAYLKGEREFADRDKFPFPWLLLLDLKMPVLNGLEVLAWIRKQPAFNSLQVVVLTVSEQIRDIQKAYELGATSFLVKPLEFQELINLVRGIHGYWVFSSLTQDSVRHPPSPDPDPNEEK